MFKVIHPNRWFFWAIAIILIAGLLLWWAVEQYSIEQDLLIYHGDYFIKSHSTTNDTSTWKTYRNEKYGFEFKYPAKATYPYTRQESDFGVLKMNPNDIEGGLNRECVASDLISHKVYQNKVGFVGISICVIPFTNISVVERRLGKDYQEVEIGGSKALRGTYGGMHWGEYLVVFHDNVAIEIEHRMNAIPDADFNQILSTFRFLE